MKSVIAEFRQRVERIAFQGIGLSVDAYSPDIFELMDSLTAGSMTPGYLEVFRAATPMLIALRRCYPSIPLPYHAEGLWWTEPGWWDQPGTAKELELVVQQARVLGSPWINHECATKRLGPYAFGTYLPPLFTSDGARVVARHVAMVQQTVDSALGCERGVGPLVLLELPPLTYFRAGDLSAATFFAEIAQSCPCGFVLDMGHLWTHYRYSATTSGVSLSEFVAGFLDEFPLERVVEIHVAGLSVHPVVPAGTIALHPDLPLWLDDHAAPIPETLYDMLEQVLGHPNLNSLRAVGLEVDTKPVKLVGHEFEQFLFRFRNTVDACRRHVLRPGLSSDPFRTPSLSVTTGPPQSDERLSENTRRYADLIVGLPGPNVTIPMLECDDTPLRWYRERYLPHEILFWGGDLRSMFPRTCERLREAACPIENFVVFWLACREEPPAPFDFFLLKLERFVRFVLVHCPEAGELVRQESAGLRDAYDAANLPLGCESPLSLTGSETERDP